MAATTAKTVRPRDGSCPARRPARAGAGNASIPARSSAGQPLPRALAAWALALLAGLAEARAESPELSAAPPELPAVEAPAADTEALPPESLQSLGDLVTAIVRQHLPVEFESRDGWGHTREVWSGVDIRRQGWQITTKRQKRQVNDGTWKLYRVRLIEPDEHLSLQVQEIRPAADGRVEFELVADARLEIFARLAQWELGVQLLSISANATARTQFCVRGDVGLKLDPTRLPPDVMLDPLVRTAELRLVDFRLERISQLGGAIAHELGQQARGLLHKELARQNEKLPDKLNRQIDKNRPRLRLSVQDLLASKWGSLAAQQLQLK